MKNYFYLTNQLIKKKGIIHTLKTALKFISKKLKLIYYRLISKDGKIVTNVQGNKMILDLKDSGLSRELVLYKIKERLATKQIYKSIRPRMTCLEVGANIGYFLLIEAKIIGKGGKIYGLEPDPRSFKILKENIKINRIKDNVEIYNIAAGNKEGKEKFFLSNHYNLSGFTEDKSNSDGKWIDVKIVKLDNFLKGKKIDFLRMDVEGYEFEVLKGMKDLLKNVQGMFIEVHHKILKDLGTRPEEFYEWIFKQGFRIKVAFSPYRKDNVYTNQKDFVNSMEGGIQVFFEKEI